MEMGIKIRLKRQQQKHSQNQAKGRISSPVALNLETMNPGLQFDSQSTSNPASGLCPLDICLERGMPSESDMSASLSSPQGQVPVVLAPGVTQGHTPRDRLHGTHL